ncbi:MAG: tetratricopeptide repeat protein [Proteobacteria bacterium]|nr:tetratricopeptide repeat protein [Pseudomonadota bacterium]MBU1688088.1 tetratricopeptide repeat protein [Pseudomonadota bacterium]
MILAERTLLRNHLPHLLVLLLLIGIIYIPSFDVPFLFDDFPNIVLNPAVHAETLSQLSKSFHSEISASRPLAMLTFAVNHLLGGLNEFGYHLINLLIHLINACLLYFLLLQMPGQQDSFAPKAAFLAASLWAVNPVQTQAVTYIVQRMTSLSTMFYLCGLLSYCSYRRGDLSVKPAALLILGSFLIGLGCKEIILTLPLALLLFDFIFYPIELRRNRWLILTTILLSGALALIYLHGHPTNWFSPLPNRNFSAWERVMTQWRVLWHYLGLFLLPIPRQLHLTYNISVSKGLLNPTSTLVGGLAILTSVIGAFHLRKRYPLISWSLLFFFLAIGPESSFIGLEMAFIHRLYLPTLFLWWAVITTLPVKSRAVVSPVLLMLITLLAFWTIERNNEWQNRQRFWESNISRGAETARAKNNLATAYMDGGRFEEALALLDQGLAMDTPREEDRQLLLYNRGYSLFYLNRHPEALTTFQRIAREYGGFRHTYLFIGSIFLKAGDLKRVNVLISEIRRYPEISYQGDILEAELLQEKGQYDEAWVLIHNTLDHSGTRAIYIQQRLQLELAQIAMKQGNFTEAYKIFIAITERYPDNYSAWKMIYLMLESAGDHDHSAKVKKFLEANGIMVEKP